MKRIYVMGAISSINPLQFLENIRKGLRLSTECLLSGYAVFSPFLDFNLFLQLHNGEHIPVDLIRASSMAWLEASDGCILVPGWENSIGTKQEMDRASSLNIPVFFSLEELKKELLG